MKTEIKYLLIFVLIIFSVSLTKQLSAQQNQISFQVFYDQLSPYGQWIDYPEYGYVWIPDGGSDFAPYSTAGHWILTDYGWTWASDYEWGWAPFHYGRWDFDNSFGWFWVPDNEWGPAWVNWRSADGYYGWEPMQPGVTITIGFHREYNERNDHWLFVKNRDIDRPHVNMYFVGRADHDRIIRNSTVVRNTYDDRNRNTTYVTGPRRDEVQKATGRKYKTVVIQENTNPGQNIRNGKLILYKPQVNKDDNKEHRIAPSRVTNIKDLKESSERRTTNQPNNVKPTNTRQERKSNAVNPPRNSTKEQPRKVRTDKDKKRTE